VRVTVELGVYTIGLTLALGSAAGSAFHLLTAFGVPVMLGLIMLPFVLASVFAGFHKSFDYSIELYDKRHELAKAEIIAPTTFRNADSGVVEQISLRV
jgi:hypothetical protein